MSKALFVGRFQPFHLGHLDAVKQIIEDHDFVLIVIGSAQYSRTEDNPFSFAERREMIKTVLKKENIDNYEIYGIDDVNNNEIWIERLEKFLPGYDAVFSMNDVVRKIFMEKGKKVEDIKFNIDINATYIRDMAKSGNKNFEKYVHLSIKKNIIKALS